MYFGYLIMGFSCIGLFASLVGMLGFETERKQYDEQKTMHTIMTGTQYFLTHLAKFCDALCGFLQGYFMVQATKAVVRQIDT